MQTTLLTHTDLDGVGCAVLFAGARPGQGPIELVENGAIDERVLEVLDARLPRAAGHEVLVTDHGIDPVTADAADGFVAAGGRFMLLDHHRSSRPLAGRRWAVVDEDRSATGLLFDHLGRPPAFADFARLVEDHDLWRHQDERSARLATLLGLVGAERFMARFGGDPAVELREAERLLVDYEEGWREEYVRRKVGQARVVELGGCRWAVCFAEQYQSDLAERLMRELGVAATAIVNPGKRTVSLRGRGVDVSAIAQRFGGGGHARAAAFTFRGAALEAGLDAFERGLDEELGR
ncbi:MAG TPA: DHHA1 domain-containing protein [Candidatus Dormibacteraeota bacterium]|nr:DHHA1 domain-containing protein [Candidatus Dormibacteraeota bacterium]